MGTIKHFRTKPSQKKHTLYQRQKVQTFEKLEIT